MSFGTFAPGETTKLEQLISSASAGCFAAMDQLNPRSYYDRQLAPYYGFQINIIWKRLISTETNPSIELWHHTCQLPMVANRKTTTYSCFSCNGDHFPATIDYNAVCYIMASQKAYCIRITSSTHVARSATSCPKQYGYQYNWQMIMTIV